jgi:hypothetical protein
VIEIRGETMGEVEELEARILNLSGQDETKLREWFLQLDIHQSDGAVSSDGIYEEWCI